MYASDFDDGCRRGEARRSTVSAVRQGVPADRDRGARSRQARRGASGLRPDGEGQPARRVDCQHGPGRRRDVPGPLRRMRAPSSKPARRRTKPASCVAPRALKLIALAEVAAATGQSTPTWRSSVEQAMALVTADARGRAGRARARWRRDARTPRAGSRPARASRCRSGAARWAR